MEISREDILTAAVAIAKRNGYEISEDFFTEIPAEMWVSPSQEYFLSIIFDKDFAKCFWGEETFIEFESDEEKQETQIIADLDEYENPLAFIVMHQENFQIPAWQFHLMQMAISKDPIKYLQGFLEIETKDLGED